MTDFNRGIAVNAAKLQLSVPFSWLTLGSARYTYTTPDKVKFYKADIRGKDIVGKVVYSISKESNILICDLLYMVTSCNNTCVRAFILDKRTLAFQRWIRKEDVFILPDGSCIGRNTRVTGNDAFYDGTAKVVAGSIFHPSVVMSPQPLEITTALLFGFPADPSLQDDKVKEAVRFAAFGPEE